MVRRGTDAVGGNLPAELSSFVGRRRDLAEITRLTSEYRLVTLHGIGGVGKTRLARRAAAQLRRAFPDGAWFVDLAELGRPGQETPDRDDVAHLVAAALGLAGQALRTPLEALRVHLAQRCLLLVLDNCEQLLPACAAMIQTLLRTCPDLRILATSREPVGLAGEASYPVPPLPSPDPDQQPALADLLEFEAVALFAARGAAVLAGFRLTADNCTAVADICHRLDGLPLAIELAAARLRVLSPEQIAARLTDRFALLRRGDRRAPDRQQTLRGCIDWSFLLCTAPERSLWARLSVFSGSFEIDAIEGICADDEIAAEDLLDLVASLVDKSILSRSDRGSVVRYRMLETIRAFGREKLRASGAEAALSRRHCIWYEEMVERASTEWIGGRQAYWLNRLNEERANLRTAIDFRLGESGPDEGSLRILVTLPVMYWWGRGMYNEGIRWLDRALDRRTPPSPRRARALVLGSRLAFAQGDGELGSRLLEEGEELARRLDDAATIAYATFIRGTGALFGNDVPRAVALFENSLAHLNRAAQPLLDQRLHVLFTLVAATGLAGDEKRAADCYAEVMSLTEPRGENLHRSNAMWAFGLAAWRQGDLAAAAAHQEASLRLKQAGGLDDPLGTALCLEVLAWVEGGRRPRRAAVLLGVVDAQWIRHGSSIRSYRHLMGYRTTCEQRTRRALDEPAFQEAYRHGRSLTCAESLAYALHERRQHTAEQEPESQTRLTRREHEIAVLVADGLSNREIAKKLVISQRTAESHVGSILTKRGYTSRSQIAAWIAAPAANRPDE